METTTTTTPTGADTGTTSRSPMHTADMPDTFGTGRRRIWLGAIGAAVAIAAIGIVLRNVDDASVDRSPTVTLDQRKAAADLERIAIWAEANGVSGLSPTSLRPREEQLPNFGPADLPRTADAITRWLAP